MAPIRPPVKKEICMSGTDGNTHLCTAKIRYQLMSNRPLAIDLFSGAGGFSHGITWAGFDVRWAIDSEEHCKRTFERNHSDTEFVCDDIRDVDPGDLPFDTGDLDLIVGGPPCPTFSTIGRGKINSVTDAEECGASGEPNTKETFKDRRTPGQDSKVLTDERHYLFEDFIRFVSTLRPSAFLMENVPGMRTTETESGENVEKRIKRKLREEGYRVSAQVLNAADYGVPQHRRRLFFIGNRLDRDNPVMSNWATHREPLSEQEKNVDLLSKEDQEQSNLGEFGLDIDRPFRSYQANRKNRAPWVTVGDAILDLPPVSPDGTTPPKEATEYTIPPVTEYQQWVRDLPGEGDQEKVELHNHECRGHNLTDLTLYKLLGEGVGWTLDVLDEELNPYRSDIFKDQYKKDDPRAPASTVMAHMQKDGHRSIHPREARSYTVREAARLQSFRDSFVFPVSRSQAFQQVGNAVPPLLAEALATAIRTKVLQSGE